MVYVDLDPVVTNTVVSKVWGDQVDANLDALNRDILRLPPTSVSGTASLGLQLDYLAVASVGSASAEGSVSFESFSTAPGFLGGAGGGVEEAVVYVISGGVTGNLRLEFFASFGQIGGLYTTGSDSIALASYAVTANFMTAIDIAAVINTLPAASVAQSIVGITMIRRGADVLDTCGALYVVGARIILKQ